VSSLQQQVEELQRAAESSQAAHKQVVEQLKQALGDKDLLEQQLQAVMLQGPAGSSMVTALAVHLWIACAARLRCITGFESQCCPAAACCLFVLAACLLPC